MKATLSDPNMHLYNKIAQKRSDNLPEKGEKKATAFFVCCKNVECESLNKASGANVVWICRFDGQSRRSMKKKRGKKAEELSKQYLLKEISLRPGSNPRSRVTTPALKKTDRITNSLLCFNFFTLKTNADVVVVNAVIVGLALGANH
jgi:hypothetical protein